jgi:DNA-binding GntR family transcriptional regulator
VSSGYGSDPTRSQQGNPIQATQKVAAITDTLRQEILVGDLSQGDRLTELEIASRFGTSQGPVRESLRILHGEGLVVRKPSRGTYVSEISMADTIEAYELRAIVEGRAARELATRWNEEIEAQMRGAVEPMASAADRGDDIALAEADLAFHRLLCELAGPPIRVNVWQSLAMQTRRYKTISDRLNWSDPHEIVATHRPVLDALASGDPEAAEAAITKHVLFASRLLSGTVESD